MADKAIKLVAARDQNVYGAVESSFHPVKHGQEFSIADADRAARLVAKGLAHYAVEDEAPVEIESPAPAGDVAPKVDGRTKAGKAARHK